MDTFVNYEDGKIHFSMPKGWSLISGQDKPPVSGVHIHQMFKKPSVTSRKKCHKPMSWYFLLEVILSLTLGKQTPIHFCSSWNRRSLAYNLRSRSRFSDSAASPPYS